jgi:hypothetical protein
MARRPLSGVEIRHLRLLQFVRTQARDAAAVYDEQIEDFVYELREDGCSVRTIADAVDVSPSTVQLWTSHAKQRRASP